MPRRDELEETIRTLRAELEELRQEVARLTGQLAEKRKAG